MSYDIGNGPWSEESIDFFTTDPKKDTSDYDKYEPTEEEKAAWEYSRKCRSLCEEIGLDIGSMLNDDYVNIIEFLKDKDKLKRALFILDHPELI